MVFWHRSHRWVLLSQDKSWLLRKELFMLQCATSQPSTWFFLLCQTYHKSCSKSLKLSSTLTAALGWLKIQKVAWIPWRVVAYHIIKSSWRSKKKRIWAIPLKRAAQAMIPWHQLGARWWTLSLTFGSLSSMSIRDHDSGFIGWRCSEGPKPTPTC